MGRTAEYTAENEVHNFRWWWWYRLFRLVRAWNGKSRRQRHPEQTPVQESAQLLSRLAFTWMYWVCEAETPFNQAARSCAVHPSPYTRAAKRF